MNLKKASYSMRYIVFLVLIGFAGFVISQVFACECGTSTLEEKLTNADVVFQGTIMHEPVTLENHLVASFSARDIFKKPPSEFDYLFDGPHTNVTTGINSGICGVNFLKENTYIIFGNILEGKIQTSACSGTATIDNYLEQILRLQHYESSPLKQFKAGISIEEVKCKDNFVLLTKASNNFPVCVKPETKTKLIERGWATADQLENKIITSEDNDKLIDIKKGESFIVKLDSDYDWRISIDNQTVVDSDYSDIRYSGSQGVYRAHNSGQAILTGVGDPLCLSLDPPCMATSILFQLNINVK